MWTDGTEYDYNEWENGEPNDQYAASGYCEGSGCTPDEDCTSMTATTGKWHDMWCDSNRNKVPLCKNSGL